MSAEEHGLNRAGALGAEVNPSSSPTCEGHITGKTGVSPAAGNPTGAGSERCGLPSEGLSLGGRGLRISVCVGLGFRDYSLFGEKHPHVKGLLGRLPLALLKQGALRMRSQPAARRGSLSRSRQGVWKLPKRGQALLVS